VPLVEPPDSQGAGKREGVEPKGGEIEKRPANKGEKRTSLEKPREKKRAGPRGWRIGTPCEDKDDEEGRETRR